MERVLFVCTGNTCRSPMAEAVFNKKRNSDIITAKSAGVYAEEGMPMSEGSKQALARHGMMESHQSRPLTENLLEWADLILTLTTSHKQAVISRFPDCAAQIFTLKEYVTDDNVSLNKIEELKAELVELELKRASFANGNQQKTDNYSEDKKVSEPGKLAETLLEQLEPHQRVIDRLEWDLPSADIRDPFGGDDSIYEATYQEIEEAVEKLIVKIERENKNSAEEE